MLLLDLITLIGWIEIKLGLFWKQPANWTRPVDCAAGHLPTSVVRTLSRSQLVSELERLTFCPHFKVSVMNTKHLHSPKYWSAVHFLNGLKALRLQFLHIFTLHFVTCCQFQLSKKTPELLLPHHFSAPDFADVLPNFWFYLSQPVVWTAAVKTNVRLLWE